MPRTSPNNITELAPNEVFVYGSNTAGVNGRGAALQARIVFGALNGIGEGFTGYKDCCYAFPTLKWIGGRNRLAKRSHGDLMESAAKFIHTTVTHPDKLFLLTKVGCGLAGYDEEYMQQFFVAAPPNVIKPEGW